MAKKIIKLTDEMKSKLLGLVPVNNNFTISFTPPAYGEIPEEFQPKFTLKPWKASEMRGLAQLDQTDDSGAYEYLCKQIVDVENLFDLSSDEGELIKPDYVDGHITREFLETVPPKVVMELLTKVSQISGA
jgi:hypothetical protein